MTAAAGGGVPTWNYLDGEMTRNGYSVYRQLLHRGKTCIGR